MAQVINTNVFSLNSQRALMNSQMSMKTSLERLSSGLRINHAKDDAAGLAIAERMTSQIRGLGQAMRNVNDGVSMIQTADGAMEEISNSLQRMRELAVQASTDTVNTTDKGSLNSEFAQLSASISEITSRTTFNNVSLLDGASINVQSGYNSGESTSVSLTDVSSLTALSDDISSTSGASGAITKLDADLDRISSARATAGAAQSRLESTARNLANVIENVSSARSGIRDADFAAETANLTRTQILQQAGAAMLAQANQLPQNVLSLLR